MARDATSAPRANPRGRELGLSDGQLLRQFLARPDGSAEAAFSALIGRHGPLVHRVCRDVLRNPEDARDAAQAAFLVLARNAGSIRKPEALGPWLHGVALRVARRARSEAARRRAAERRKAEIMHDRTREPGPDPLGHAELHEEVDRLPEKYRRPIVLCYLHGRTQAEAAGALGWPLGTVQIRLHRGRDLPAVAADAAGRRRRGRVRPGDPLRDRRHARAGVGRDDGRAAVRFAAGKGTAGLVSPAVTGLAESTLTAMLIEPLKVVALTAIALVLVAAALIGTGVPRRSSATAMPGERPGRPLGRSP